jgi:hypothetical protein
MPVMPSLSTNEKLRAIVSLVVDTTTSLMRPGDDPEVALHQFSKALAATDPASADYAERLYDDFDAGRCEVEEALTKVYEIAADFCERAVKV